MATWYYEKDGSQAGPVTEAEINQLILNHQITESSLLWRSGFPDWQPLRSVSEFNGSSGAPAGGLKLKPVLVKTTPGTVKNSQPVAPTAPISKPVYYDEEDRVDEDSFWQSFEYRFFLWSLIVAIVLTIPLFFLKNEAFVFPVFIQGILCMAVAGIIFRIKTFQESIWWGLGGLLIGITDVIFMFMFWSRISRSFALAVTGFAILFSAGFAFVLAQEAGFIDWVDIGS
ncbi:MAG: DUF4339 domain-containing protein [Verrucomicrobiota bacterium]